MKTQKPALDVVAQLVGTSAEGLVEAAAASGIDPVDFIQQGADSILQGYRMSDLQTKLRIQRALKPLLDEIGKDTLFVSAKKKDS